MAFEGEAPVKLVGCKAGAGLTASTIRFTFVKFSADLTVVPCTGATDIPCGVIQSEVAATGDPVDVIVIGQTMVQADASLTAGNLIGTSADGQADAKTAGTDTTEYTVGQVVGVLGGSSAGNYVTALINCAAPCRAA